MELEYNMVKLWFKIMGSLISILFIGLAYKYRIELGAAPPYIVLPALVSMFFLLFMIPRKVINKVMR